MCPQCKAESVSPCPALAQAVDLHLVTHGGPVLGDPATLHEQFWTPSGPSKHPPAYSASQTGCAGDGDKQLQHVQPVGRGGHELACPLGTRRWPVPGGHGWRVVTGEAELCPGRCSKMRRSHLLLPKSLLLPSSPDKRMAGSRPPGLCPQPGTNQNLCPASEASGHCGLHCPGSAAGANFIPGTPTFLPGSTQH